MDKNDAPKIMNENTYKIINLLGFKFRLKPNKYEDHYVLNFLGIKFKFSKSKNKKLRNTFNYYKKNNIDITTFPKAEGDIRELQLANLSLLLFLDKLCKENNIAYWLDFGTLLGAVRHKGFIPWDDDIDVSMMRDDYERIIDIINNNPYNSDIYAEFNRDEEKGDCIGKYFHIKIRHKKCPNLFVDIFPYDYLGKNLNHEDKILISKMAFALKRELSKKYDYSMESQIIKSDIDEKRNKYLKFDETDNKNSDLIWGIDYLHYWNNWVYTQETIFPLQDIEFEGHIFKCANKKEDFLAEVYGNYMSYPENFTHIHNLFRSFSNKEQKVIKELLKDL